MTYKVDINSLTGPDIPNVYIQTVVLSDGSCELKLSLKDILNNSDRTSKGWSNNTPLYSQFKLKIIRSLDAETTKELTSLTSPRGARILEKIREKSFKNRVSVEEVSLAGTTSSDLDANASSTIIDGKLVKDFVITHNDTVLPKALKHLTYFVIVYYKLLDVSSNLGSRSEGLVGVCATQTVIRAGTVPKKATLYVLKENSETVWAGPVHVMKDGQYHTGMRHSPQSRALVRKAVDNDKVQDLRGERFDFRGVLDTSIAKFEKFPTPPGEIKFSFKNSVSVADRNAIFTDLYSAHDNNGNIRILFGIDQNALKLYYTKLGVIYGQTFANSALEDIPRHYLQTGEIRRLTLKRRRVNPSSEFNRLCSPINGRAAFDNEAVDSILFEGTPATIDRGTGVVKTMNIFTSAPASGLKYYGALDTGLRDMSYGKYQYKVELEVLDKSDEIVQNIIQDLSEARRALVSYLNEGILPTNYDKKLNKFTKAFITSGRGSAIQAALTTYARALGFVSLISDNKSFDGVKGTLRLLEPFVISANANPGTVQSVIDRVESLLAVVGRLGGTGTRTGIGSQTSDLSSIQQDAKDKTSRNTNSSLKIIEVENIFEDQFDADFVRDVGYDYLSTGPHSTAAGPFTIKDSAYFERVNVETNKYFVSNDVDIDIAVKGKRYTERDTLRNTDAQYLSPASTTIFGSTHKMIDALKADDYRYREVEKDVLYYNLQLSLNDSVAAPDDPTCKSEVREELLMNINSISNLGTMQVKQLNSIFNTDNDNSATESDFLVAPSFDEPPYLPGAVTPTPGHALNSAVFGGILRKQTLVQDSNDDCTTGYTSNIDSFNAELNYNEAFSLSPDRQQKLVNLPNQIKSIVLGNISLDAINIDWFQTQLPESDDIMGPLFRLNFNALHQVEVLIGFERSPSGASLVKKPIFVPLTRQRIESAPLNLQLVCRLVAYTNTDFGLNGLPNNLKLPIYNEYFVIERTTGVPLVTTAPDTTLVSSQNSARQEMDSTEVVQYSHTEPPAPLTHRRVRTHTAPTTTSTTTSTAPSTAATKTGVY